MIAQKFYPNDIAKKSRAIDEILCGRHWKDIACNYTFWIKYPNFNSRLWTIWDIEELCQIIQENSQKSNKEIVKIFLQNHSSTSEKTAYNLVYNIRNKRKYTIVSKYYNF